MGALVALKPDQPILLAEDYDNILTEENLNIVYTFTNDTLQKRLIEEVCRVNNWDLIPLNKEPKGA